MRWRDAPVVGIVGATGRLGSALDRELTSRGIPVSARGSRSRWEVEAPPTVVFDASSAACLRRTVEVCRSSSAGLVYAVSDVPAANAAELRALARDVPVILATNLSIGHWIQLVLLEAAAGVGTLSARPLEATVWERHPATKADRPSASARELADMWQTVTGRPALDVASRRAGHPVSDHVVQLDLPHESVSITHAVTSIDAAVRGALLFLDRLRTAPAGLETSRQAFDNLFRERTRLR